MSHVLIRIQRKKTKSKQIQAVFQVANLVFDIDYRFEANSELIMTNFPLVSIVTPSFNQGQFLEETILSVLHQDYPNIEYIVIDGGSTDDSVRIIEKYQDKLSYWVSEKDNGQTDALIKGFSRTTGKYITWLCSDDLIEPSMVSISGDFLERNPDVACTYGDRVRIDGKGNLYSLQRYPQFYSWFPRLGIGLPQETTLIRRSIYDAVGGLDPSLHMAMDFDLWCRIALSHPIRHIPAVLGRFRAHAGNKSTVFSQQEKKSVSGDSGAYYGEYCQVYERHFNRTLPRRVKALFATFRPLRAFFYRRSAGYRNSAARARDIRLV